MPEQSKLALTIAEAAHQISVSRSKFYELISANLIETKKIGRRRVVPVCALQDFIGQHKSKK